MKKIAIIPNYIKDNELKITKKIISKLLDKAEVYMHNSYSDFDLTVTYKGDDIYEFVDAVIILGGDGSILQAAEPCAKLQIPIMGVNLGRIGFMTEIEIEDIDDALQNLLLGNYKIEERMMMSVSVNKSNGDKSVYYALNDAVISKPDAQMISLELYRENEKINGYIADGIIISTPTGSTGYSLSAGGPVADPTMEMFVATPICAHTLLSRTAILPADRKIFVKLLNNGNNLAELTIDGQVRDKLLHGETVEIQRFEKKVKLIRTGSQSFYDIMIKKLS